MKLHSLIIDDFLDPFDDLRAYADLADYETLENPVDGVQYPGICSHIPEAIQIDIGQRLARLVACPVTVHFMFMRLSLSGVPVPHQAHTDVSMGAFSLMLYVNRAEDCRGGTALVRHESGMDRNPVDVTQQNLWRRDTNDPGKWTPYVLCEMKPNRAFVFDAALMHRSEPIGGFGSDPKNGRLVLTAFFS